MGETLSKEAAAEKCRQMRAEGRKLVFTNGCFDLLHPGHVSYLKQARELGDALIIALNSDASVQRLKGPLRPILQEQERAAVISALACVDLVTIFDEDTPLETIISLHPDVLVKGGDWTPDNIVGRKEVESWGGTVLSLPFVNGLSTTELIRRILRAEGK